MLSSIPATSLPAVSAKLVTGVGLFSTHARNAEPPPGAILKQPGNKHGAANAEAAGRRGNRARAHPGWGNLLTDQHD